MRVITRLEERLAVAFSRPSGKPLALCGPTGAGKTTLLRRASARTGRHAVWLSAFDLVHDLTSAIRQERYPSYGEALAADPLPLCVEHLEDLRGLPCARGELGRLLQRAACRRPLLLTLTHARGDAEVRAWLGTWTDVVSLPR